MFTSSFKTGLSLQLFQNCQVTIKAKLEENK